MRKRLCDSRQPERFAKPRLMLRLGRRDAAGQVAKERMFPMGHKLADMEFGVIVTDDGNAALDRLRQRRLELPIRRRPAGWPQPGSQAPPDSSDFKAVPIPRLDIERRASLSDRAPCRPLKSERFQRPRLIVVANQNVPISLHLDRKAEDAPLRLAKPEFGRHKDVLNRFRVRDQQVVALSPEALQSGPVQPPILNTRGVAPLFRERAVELGLKVRLVLLRKRTSR